MVVRREEHLPAMTGRAQARERSTMPVQMVAMANTLPPAQHGELADAGLDLARAMRLLRRRWRLAALITILGTLLAIGLITLLPVTYRAEALMVLDPRRSKVSELQTQTDALLGRLGSLLPPAASGGPPIEDSISPERRLDLAMEALGRAVSVVNEGGSYTLRVVANASDPELAARIANTVAEVHLAEQQRLRASERDAEIGWLKDRLDGLRHTVQESDAAVEGYRTAHRLGQGSSAAVRRGPAPGRSRGPACRGRRRGRDAGGQRAPGRDPNGRPDGGRGRHGGDAPHPAAPAAARCGGDLRAHRRRQRRRARAISRPA